MHLPISGYETEQKRIRIYIKSFLSSKNEQEYEKQKEILKKRDHRYIGKQQQLYFSHKLSPGSTFFLPNGLFILKKLKNFIRNKYNLFNYQEVQTPLLFKKELFDISGHWQNYQKDMFQVSSCCGSHEGGEEDEITGLKPMNCPAHCLIFDSKPRMESDLPIRLADFGTLHRNEASGALTGLTRVRQFHQDDGHIFCTKEQINSEISSTLKMLKEVYTALELPNYDLTLSTRPTENFIGDIETWNSAETQLKQALDDTGLPWSVKEGDGAFYGPKIDIMIKDNYNRSHQTATIQLDFQLPSRFNLKYRTQENEWKTPVIVHRAIFGSLERIFAILIENYAGRWPFWLNPKQIIMLPFNDKEVIEYTEGKMKVLGKMYKQKYFSELKLNIDNSNKAISSKIKQAQIEQFNFMLVIGKEEMENETLTVRYRDGKIVKGVNMEQFVDLVFELNQPYL
ncbi:threonyl-tRNA synthetase [Neoconidiobolus thromboides FSU 785]|nr:threonyl-tRNA synthetase [Neoconidiobolus thromboides FSU 785]